ncbi:MAG: alpha/beta hydrolase [Gammaproteobacteria bacterium]
MATNISSQQRGYILPLILLAAAATTSVPLSIAYLAHKIVAPVHSSYQPTVGVIDQLSPYCTTALRVPVGPPNAVLSVIIVYPWLKTHHAGFSSSVGKCVKSAPHKLPVKGTILALPGYGLPKATLLPYSTLFAAHGYQTILVDLRAQGQSTGNHIGYGKQEAKDLTQLLHHLRQHGLVTGKLGLFGISYGAAVALDTAAIEKRITAVVAVGAFAQVAPVIHQFIAVSDPELASKISAAELKQAISDAGRLVGYPLNQSDPLKVVSAIDAPVLYVAGAKDTISPLSGIRALAEKTCYAHVVVKRDANHLVLASDPALVEKDALQWFNRFLVSHKPINHPQNAEPVDMQGTLRTRPATS